MIFLSVRGPERTRSQRHGMTQSQGTSAAPESAVRKGNVAHQDEPQALCHNLREGQASFAADRPTLRSASDVSHWD